ncbi:MAG TPA: 3-methyladenine DNA glycosylase 2 [Rhodocyclaceae bacterium]|nr:3-methyladenine DNA glycosylase 2 [Rhodocyclaceae bacterium]
MRTMQIHEISDSRIALPPSYRSREVLIFHGRDPQQVAEKVSDSVILKGMTLDGAPALLRIELDSQEARYELDAESNARSLSPRQLRETVERILGLHIESDHFESLVTQDKLLGGIVQRQRGLRIPQTATPFEAITWAIIGQQINLAFAITLRRRLIELVGLRHSSGLACYPDASKLACVDVDALVGMQFSRAKSETLMRVARLVEDGTLDLLYLAACDPDEAALQLTAIKGIGPWTAQYVLMRGLGAVDCSLHGDAAVRAAIVKIKNNGIKLDQTTAQRILERYKPYRSLAAAHLWASLAMPNA